jgi:hypothetical protein
VVIQVSDGTATASETIQVMVNEVNVTPVLAAVGNNSVNEGALLSFTAAATDSDVPAQTLTFSLGAGAPAGASITSGGVFAWTPTEAQGPSTNSVTIQVSDGTATANETIQIVVSEVNTAPGLATIPNYTNFAGVAISFTVGVTDADLPANRLLFSLEPGAPAGAELNTTNGLFTWTPSTAQAPGVYSIGVRVTDDGVPSLHHTKTFVVALVSGLNIASATVSNNAIRLTWNSVPGKSYQVQSRNSLTVGTWSDLGIPVVATGATTIQSYPLDTQPARFYRILQKE